MVARGILFRWRTAVRRRFFFAAPNAGRVIRPFSNGLPFEQQAALSAKCAGRHFTPGPDATTISIGELSTLDQSRATARRRRSTTQSWAKEKLDRNSFSIDRSFRITAGLRYLPPRPSRTARQPNLLSDTTATDTALRSPTPTSSLILSKIIQLKSTLDRRFLRIKIPHISAGAPPKGGFGNFANQTFGSVDSCTTSALTVSAICWSAITDANSETV
jgi:hypothetical protein